MSAFSPTLPPEQLAEAIAVAAASKPPPKSPAATPVPTTDSRAAESSAQVITEPVAKSTRIPWLAISIGIAGIAALGVAVALVLGKNDKPQNETAFIVVDQRGSDGSAVKAAAPPLAAVIDAGVATPAAVIDAGAAATPPKPATDTDVAALTRTFGTQGPAITACFKQHGEPTEQVSIRIQIDRSGAVVSAVVLPEDVGGTALGACIADVAKKTRFGAQPKGATFRVPLYTKGR